METLYRKPQKLDTRKNYTFQTLEWSTHDENLEGDGERFVIRAFGVDDNGFSVCCTIKEYLPYFYIKIPKYWKLTDVMSFIEDLKKLEKNGKKILNYYVRESILKKNCEIEYHKEFYGFTNNEKFKFCKMVFNTEKGMKAFKYAINNIDKYRGVKISLYEVNLEPLLKFFHEKEILPSNWVNITNFDEIRETEVPSTCQVNIECNYTDVEPNNKSYNSNFVQASYDIETYSKSEIRDDGKEYYPFPVSEKLDNVIYQIGTCFKRFNEPDFFIKTLLTLKKSKKVEDNSVHVIECIDERDLLLKWKKLIESIDPDVLYQYNGDSFDCQYMVKRAELLGIKTKFLDVSRLYDYPAILKEEVFSSSARGTTNFKRLKIPGRINYDILIFLRREYKENSYKLNDIAYKYLGEKKLDVSVQEIFKAYETGSEDQIQRIGLYCVQDTVLPQKLVDTLHIIQTELSMSNVTFVPIRYLIERGQQIKALSQISKSANKKGYLLPFFQYSEEIDKFQGATVLEPDKGLYDMPITVLDFASLYPSIIRAHDLCYTTIVLNKDYLNLPGVDYLDVDIDGKTYFYARGQVSVLKDLLSELAKERTKYKKLMKTSDNEAIIEIYNKTQSAYKVSMNSCYGILGTGTVGCKPIAATITKIGRDMIQSTKDYIESHHHNVYPIGYDTDDLNECDDIIVKINEVEKKIKVKELANTPGDIYLKTNKGWRKYIS
jgi:DNA polymerase delta subunit 1